MIIEINNKDFELVFDYEFVNYVMKKHNWTKFTEYYAYIGENFAFEQSDFGPDHLEKFAKFILWGIEAAKGGKKAFVKAKQPLEIKDIVKSIWSDMQMFQDVMQEFMRSQPKANGVVDPASRDVGK